MSINDSSQDDEEICMMLRDLMKQADQKPVDDLTTFSINYFKNISTCTHIMGTNFSYVLETNHNRKCFVYCMKQMLQGFNEEDEMTSSEFHSLLEAAFPNFPKALITEASITATETFLHVALISDHKYPIGTLQRFVAYLVLYDDWWKILEDYFQEETTGGGGGNGNSNTNNTSSLGIAISTNNKSAMIMNIAKLKMQIDEFYRILPLTIHKPPYLSVIDTLENNETTRNNGEISYEKLKKGIFLHDSVEHEWYLLSQSYPLLC